MTMQLPQSHPGPRDGAEVQAPWRPRSHIELLAAQLRAIEEWHRRAPRPGDDGAGRSREAKLDLARLRSVADCERKALLAWADRALLITHPFGRGGVPRAVVAHRQEWLRDKVSAGLCDSGVEVVLCTGDGADACAAVVMEQPDLLFVEDLLPSLGGVELIRRARVYAPETVIGVHAIGPTPVPLLLDSGVRVAFSRRIPPADIAATLVDCLHGRTVERSLV